jgi:hypothetical protein
MIELTEQQWKELETAAVPRVLDPRSQKTYVLISEEVYQRLKGLLGDDTVYTTAEMVDAVMAEADAGDPYLAELQQKYLGVSP